MSEQSDYGKVLLQHLARIQRSVRYLCRSSGINDTDAEDCSSWVTMRIVEDDYAILRKFEGRCMITTYLSVVVARLVNDWRAARWGRWRLSAEAQRLGAIACALERLVYRDSCTLAEAMQIIRSEKGDAAPSEREMIAIFAKIPRRGSVRPRQIDESELNSIEAGETADHNLEQGDRDIEWQQILAAIGTAVDRLSPEDRLIARLRLFDGLSVAQIARALAVQQKPLYRRLVQVMSRLSAELERLGFPKNRFKEYLAGDN